MEDPDPKVLLFGDVVCEKLPALRKLYSASLARPQLKRFLTEATATIRREKAILPASERLRIRYFDDILQLGEWHAAETRPDILTATTILAVTQLGEYLILAEDDPSVLGGKGSQVYLFGVCQGAIPATVAAAARDTSSIVTFGVEAVAIVFRLAVHLMRRTKNVEDSEESWICTVHGADPDDVQKLLDKFNEDLFPSRRVYLGIVTKAWSTLFGPPCSMDALKVSSLFRHLSLSSLPNGVAVHAPYLPSVDVDAIVGKSPTLSTVLPPYKHLSLSKKAFFRDETLGDLLRSVVLETSDATIWLEDSISELVLAVEGCRKLTLTPVGPPSHAAMLRGRLQQHVGEVQIEHPKVGASTGSSSDSGDFAIVGMSGRFPQCDSIDEFWECLMNGVDTCEEIPASRFPIDSFYDPNSQGLKAMSARHGCFMKNPGDFDNGFFKISPKEALQMDPVQRMLLMITYEALQAAGYAANADRSRFATFFGQATQDWWSINDTKGPEAHYMTSNVRAFTPGKLNHFFRWSGGFTSVDTACTSSLTALYQACNALLARECDAAIVGGGQLCVIPEAFSGISKGSFLSPTGQCKTFQDSADGYCRGEAVGVVVIKRLEDALRDNDDIVGVVKGIARNNNAGGGSITYPEEQAQVDVFRKLLRRTGAHPNDIGFVEMHGTGTIAGDTTEMTSVRRVFAQARSSDNPLHLGALKANFGHSEAAAGIVSLMKTLLVLRRGQIPPQPHQPFRLNSKFPDLDKIHIHIASNGSTMPVPTSGNYLRKAIVNGFDAAGGNACVLLEEPPQPKVKQQDERSHHVVVCSGNTASALAANEKRLLHALRDRENPLCIEDVAYTTTARRLHEKFRHAFVADSVSALAQKLKVSCAVADPQAAKRDRPPLVFAFGGQGVQYPGMASTLYQTCKTFRQHIDTFEAICHHHELDSFIEFVRDGKAFSGATSAQLQLANVAVQIALARYWQSLGFQPAAVLGHSLGEYAALCVAGVLSPTDTFAIVDERARLMDECCNSEKWRMMAIEASSEILSTVPNGCELSCINSPATTVASGREEDITSLQTKLNADGVRTKILDTRFGFHSSQMEPIMGDLDKFASKIAFKAPQIPVASTTLGRIVSSEGTFNASYLTQHMRRPVDFVGAVRACENESLIRDGSVVFELGPHPMCIGLIKASRARSQGPLKALPTLRKDADDWNCISQCVAAAYISGFDVDWTVFHRDFSDMVRLTKLPSYAWDLQTYWVPYEARNTRAVAAKEIPKTPNAIEHLTTCVQQVESVQTDGKGTMTGVFVTHTSEPNLNRVIEGHHVDGSAICPASVFIDMGLTAARYLLKQRHQTLKLSELEITDLEMKQPLVVDEGLENPTVQIIAVMDKEATSADVAFAKRGRNGSPSVEIASCKVALCTDPSDWLWLRTRTLIQSRVNALNVASNDGSAHRMLKPLVYKLFGNVVKYSAPYQALKEVMVPLEGSDVSARIEMPLGIDNLGHFELNPYTSDGLIHLAGFLLNGSLNKPADKVYISNRIGRMRVLKSPTGEERLTCYCSSRTTDKDGQVLCDVYVYTGSELYATFSDVQFQELRRDVFGKLVKRSSAPVPSLSRNTVVPAVVSRTPSADVAVQSRQNSNISSPKSAVFTPASSSVSPTPKLTSEGPNLMETLLDVTADETGVAKGEISDNTDFASIGVDSQMAIAILASFNKKTGMNLSASFFMSFYTIGEARMELERHTPRSEKPRMVSKSSTLKPLMSSSSVSNSTSNTPTPRLSETLLDVAADQTGVPREAIVDPTDFASMGIDSQMAIAIQADFQNRTGISLSASFFMSYSTVGEARVELDRQAPLPLSEAQVGNDSEFTGSNQLHDSSEYSHNTGDDLMKRAAKSAADLISGSHERSSKAIVEQAGERETVTETQGSPSGSNRESSVILLHGYPNSESAPLFLLPDQSGDIATYLDFPVPPGQRRVYALESPITEASDEVNLSVESLAGMFAKGVQATQRSGPYFVGGRGMGGALAYATARHLAVMGEKIGAVLIIDMPLPYSQSIKDYGSMNGSLLQQGPSFLDGETARAKMHTLMITKAIGNYDPAPFPGSTEPPRVIITWTAEGTRTGTEEERTAKDTGGWEEMVGVKNIRVRIAEDKTSGGSMAPRNPNAADKVIVDAVEDIFS